MKTAKELIEENYAEVKKAIEEAARAAYHNTNCEYRAYIDSEGEVGYEEWLAGDRGWLKFNDHYERHYIWTAAHQYYSILWDWWFQSKGDAAAAFAEKFGVKLDTSPTDEEGWEINESLRDNMLRQARVSGIGEAAVEKWLAEMEVEAIDDMLAQMDIDAIVAEAIKYC